MTSAQSPARYRELDAVRGIAAASVMAYHYLMVWPAFGGGSQQPPLWFEALADSPVRLLFAGSQAVILFFALSGFVLALQFTPRARPRYLDFGIRRLFRIFPAYLVVLVSAVGLRIWLENREATHSDWFNRIWSADAGIRSLAEHASLLWSFDGDVYVPVLWSLVHEWRVSLLFPLLMLALLRLSMLKGLCCALGLSAVGFALSLVFDDFSNTGLPQTALYSSTFALGAQAALHRIAIGARLRALGRYCRVALLAASLFLYAAPLIQPASRLHEQIVDVTLTSAGSVLLIMLVIADVGGSGRMLLTAVPQFLGRISYSLYLWHALVLVTAVRCAGSGILWPWLIAAVPLTLVLATATHRWIELPGMALGKALTAARKPGL